MYGVNENMLIGKFGRVVVEMSDSMDYWGRDRDSSVMEGFMMTFKIGAEHLIEG
jgi:hypothetical protein